MSEDAYRERAAQAAAVLAGRAPRPDEVARVLPAHIAETGSRGLVVASNRERVELYPVVGGRVCEEHRRDVSLEVPGGASASQEAESLEAALASLRWGGPSSGGSAGEPPPGEDDWPWLLSWLTGPKKGAGYLVVATEEPVPALAGRVREVLT